MSTPRTNAAWAKYKNSRGAQHIRSESCRLERELAAVTAERDALKHSLVRHNCGHPNCICAKCCQEEDDAELSALPRLGGY